jgi:diguanylate cyclase
MMLAMVMGLIWRNYFWGTQRLSWKALPLLGLMISGHLVIGFFLPDSVRMQFITTISPIILVLNILGALMMGRLLQREDALLRETERMERAATTDPLTDVMNRRRLNEIVETLPLPRGLGAGRALMYFDIDKFKEINDTHGHAAGDTALFEICARIKKCLRPQDYIARIGGDEFVVVLPDVSRMDAKIIAERCREIVTKEKVTFGDSQFAVTISAGMKWMREPLSFTAHLTHADRALYQAKELGRNCIVYHTCNDHMREPMPELKAVG